jgi:peptide/nickel transport system ATP-binding protein
MSVAAFISPKSASPPLLEVVRLRVHFPVKKNPLRPAREFVRAVDEVSFSVAAGETVGLVGESGCGKTTLGKAVMRLVPATSGEVRFEGENLAGVSRRALRGLRRNLQMIFQDPFSSLNPRMRVGDTVAEGLDIHGLAAGKAEREARVESLLGDVGLEAEHAQRYPHEFSGGQRQRISIARALAVRPKLLVCDEPVSALDVSVQAQVINLLQDLQAEHQLAYLFIAHDLAVVEHISHRILVMYLGKLVETGPAAAICAEPKHPYTRALISAVPVVDPGSKRKRIILPGDVPSPIHPPSGCPFHPRCAIAEPRCKTETPALRAVADGRLVACHAVTAN